MPRDATDTRDRLVRAAERRFARDGVAGAKLRDVVRDAGQANDAAVGYHFGSREGLLGAIVAKHLAVMEDRRHPPVEDVTGLVKQVIEPMAVLLQTESGRDFLRIIEQLAGWAGLEEGYLNKALVGSKLAAQLAALERAVAGEVGRPSARHRVAEFALFLTASLAQRARSLESGRRQALSDRRYVDELVVMTSAALLAAQKEKP